MPFEAGLIAPCGMNCGICLGYIREKSHCSGCRGEDAVKLNYCARCIIRNCEQIKASHSGFCYECSKYPCRRLKQLDKRYRTKYSMSMIENLEFIRENSPDTFLEKEAERWRCSHCGRTICVHRTACLFCGAEL